VLSAVQTLSFALVGNIILEIEWSMLIPFWIVLFTTSCFANVLGLNISSAFNSAVTVYVMIPLLLIPQMILSGLLFNFDKLHHLISTRGKVPVVADLMASRWAYEAMAVYNFTNNKFEKNYYQLEKIESQADYKSSYLVKELDAKRKFIADNAATSSDSLKLILNKDLHIIRQALLNEKYFRKGLEELDLTRPWTAADFTPQINRQLEAYFAGFETFYQDAFNKAMAYREKKMYDDEHDKDHPIDLNGYKNAYYNESLADLVKNVKEKERIAEFKGALIQLINPVYLDPKPSGPLDYRSHFFAPTKNLFGSQVSTYYFNILVIWIMSVLLYITLYFESLRKGIDFISRFGMSVKNKAGK
jgi:hypothetical protein